MKLLERNLIPELPISGTLGIPRSNMPQIAKDHQEEFFDYLKDEGIRIHSVKMAAYDLKPSQNEINSEKVDTWVIGKKPIVISSDNYLLDGHHQWAKVMLTDESMKIDCIKIEAPIRKLLDYAKNFSKTTYKDFQEVKGVQMKRLQDLVESVKNEFTVHSKIGTEILKAQEVLFDVLDNLDERLVRTAKNTIEKALAPVLKSLEGTDENLSNFGDKKAKPFKKEK